MGAKQNVLVSWPRGTKQNNEKDGGFKDSQSKRSRSVVTNKDLKIKQHCKIEVKAADGTMFPIKIGFDSEVLLLYEVVALAIGKSIDNIRMYYTDNGEDKFDLTNYRTSRLIEIGIKMNDFLRLKCTSQETSGREQEKIELRVWHKGRCYLIKVGNRIECGVLCDHAAYLLNETNPPGNKSYAV